VRVFVADGNVPGVGMKQGAARKLAFVVVAAGLATGCADGNGGLSTQALAPDKTVDPVCVSLASQIASLRDDGTIERLEKAADGKSSNVQVKRASLQKQADLNKANADYQARCGKAVPAAQQSASAAPSATTAAAPAKTAAATPAATPSSTPVAAVPGQAQD